MSLHMATLNHLVTHVEEYRDHRSPTPSALRTLRAINGLSAARLARLADVDRSTVRRIEEGTVRPQERTAQKLSAVFGCPVDLLFPTNSEARPATGLREHSAGTGRHDEG